MAGLNRLLTKDMKFLFLDLNDDRTPELIEAEDIQVEAHKRTRKKKATYDEMFGSLPVKQVKLDYFALTTKA